MLMMRIKLLNELFFYFQQKRGRWNWVWEKYKSQRNIVSLISDGRVIEMQ